MAETSLDKIGFGYGSGAGYGSGYGDGLGYGNGYGYGSGYGDGSGAGYGYGKILRDFLSRVAGQLSATWVLRETNQEYRRIMIEVMGFDRFFKQLDCQIVHADIDGCCNPRSLLRFPMADTIRGYLQAVKVVCPTTGRIYHLGVPSSVTTCQEAVASTFGVKGGNYHPDRES